MKSAKTLEINRINRARSVRSSAEGTSELRKKSSRRRTFPKLSQNVSNFSGSPLNVFMLISGSFTCALGAGISLAILFIHLELAHRMLDFYVAFSLEEVSYPKLDVQNRIAKFKSVFYFFRNQCRVH